MSSALAIAGASAVLQNLLSSVLNNAGMGGVTVSAVAPDLIQIGQAGTPGLQVNVFLHQVTPNAAWRNVGFPSLAADGFTRLHNPPLALDLHYLLTAYGTANFEAEALLGVAIQWLHETPVLTRSDIQNVLSPVPAGNPPASNPPMVGSAALNATGLANQIEMLKITPATLGREEVAWLWTALKSDYRPTFPFQVSVVLIQAQNSVGAALPVLRRHVRAQPNLLAQILQVSTPAGKAAPVSGDTVTLTGESLAGASQVVLGNLALGIQPTAVVLPSPANNNSVSFVVPSDSAATPFAAGVYSLQVVFPNANGMPVPSTNSVPFAVAPVIFNPNQATVTQPTTANGLPGTLVTITCNPRVWSTQSVTLILGQLAVSAQSFTGSTNSLSFQFTTTLPAGTPFARLQVDGVTSSLTFDSTVQPPAFTGPTITI